MKSYYQILIKGKKHTADLLFWITDKIQYSNKTELGLYIKKNCSFVKNYKGLNSIVAVEIDEDKYNNFIKTYDDAGIEHDFTVVID